MKDILERYEVRSFVWVKTGEQLVETLIKESAFRDELTSNIKEGKFPELSKPKNMQRRGGNIVIPVNY